MKFVFTIQKPKNTYVHADTYVQYTASKRQCWRIKIGQYSRVPQIGATITWEIELECQK